MEIKKIQQLVEAIKILPGVGEKTASRYAFDLIETNQDNINLLIEAMNAIKEINRCSKCQGYSEDEICYICLDHDRNHDKLVLVAKAKDILKIENVMPGIYYYFVLGGIIDPINGLTEKDLNLQLLKDKIKDNKYQEIVLVLPSTNEGEITSAYLRHKLVEYNLNFSKMAQGVPVGSSLEYLDEITLIKSIESAQKI